MEMAENTGASQPGTYTTQPSPVESSQFVSGQSSEMPTWKQTVMASSSYRTQETAYTQNSTAHPGKAIGLCFREPGETSSLNQQVVSSEQKKSPADPQYMQLNSTPKTCLPLGEKTAVLDTRETLYNEGSWMRTLNSDKTLLIQSTAMCESQRNTSGNHQIALSGRHSGQDPNGDHFLASVHDQTLTGDHEMPFNGDQTYYSHMTTRNGGHLTLYGSQMTAPNESQALHPKQIITTSFEQHPFGDQQSNLVADNGFYGDQMTLPNGYQAVYEPQMRANCGQTNDQMKSFSGQNVCKGQENLLSGEHSLFGYQTSGYRCDQNLTVNPQVTSSSGGQLISDFQMPTSSLDTTLHGSKRTTSSAEDNLAYHSETIPSFEETFYLGQMSTYVDQNIYPSKNGRPNIGESLNPQMTSLSHQAPYMGEPSYPRYDQNLIVNPQVTSSIGSQLISDFQIPTSSLNKALHGSKRTISSAEGNLTCHSETIPSFEETFHLGQMRTYVDQNVYPSQNGTSNIGESIDPQVTSLSNQAPYVGESSYPSSSPLIQKQPHKNSSASSLDQGQHPEMKLDIETPSSGSQENPGSLKKYSCTYKDCNKSYTRSHHLAEHLKKHNGEKIYACDDPGCTWKFYRPCDLKRHKQKHNRKRPYSCLKCNKSYSRKPYLTEHLKSHKQA